MRLNDYIPLVGEEVVSHIRLLASHIQGAKVQHINSTYLGGGVAEILSRLLPLMNEVGLETEWTVLEGHQAFFDVTKNFHNALHGAPSDVDSETKRAYRRALVENADKVRHNSDFVVIHDPQPLGLIDFRSGQHSKWIWRCHIDVSRADLATWAFLKPFIDRFDAAVLHIPQFLREDLVLPQYIMPPFIDPLSDKNRDLAPR